MFIFETSLLRFPFNVGSEFSSFKSILLNQDFVALELIFSWLPKEKPALETQI